MCSNNVAILEARYILEYEMGHGATSKVYKAKDSLSDKDYAIKIFEKHSEIFDREVLINKKISESGGQSQFFIKYISSSLNATLDIDGFKESKCYILYELASKGDLLNYITKYGIGLDEKNCKVINYKFLKALQALHEIGISHRDIKADNILLSGERFDIKIGDFGFSGFINGIDEKNLKKERIGTPQYMAPEIIAKKEYDGKKVDIFSTGVLLFTLLTCKMPFPKIKKGDKIKQLYKYIKDKDEEKYWEVLKENKIDGLSPEFKDLFLKMVAYEPSERPSIKEILNHAWMKEVTNLNEEEYKKYEEDLITELKKRE